MTRVQFAEEFLFALCNITSDGFFPLTQCIGT